MRGCRWRVRKLPKPRISILSPLRKERTTLSNMASTMTSDSFRVISTTRETSSIKSAFVIPRSRILIAYESAVSLDSRQFASSLRFRFLKIHGLLDGGSGRHGVPLVVPQADLFLVVHRRPQTEANLLFRLAHLDDLKTAFLTHRQRWLGAALAQVTRHLGKVAQAFHAFGQLDKSAEARQPAHLAVHRVAHLVGLEE